MVKTIINADECNIFCYSRITAKNIKLIKSSPIIGVVLDLNSPLKMLENSNSCVFFKIFIFPW